MSYQISLEFLGDWEFWIALFTFILAAATIALAVRTSDLVKSAEKSSERQLRAYVFVVDIAITGIDVGLVPSVQLIIENSGQTPAKNLEVWNRMGISTFPKSSVPPDIDDSDPSINSIGPGGKTVISSSFNSPLAANQLDVIKKGTHAIYCIGEMAYEDAFGVKRITKFKFFKNGTNLHMPQMRICADGNDYT